MLDSKANTQYDMPDERGHFGQFGGIFVAETLVEALEELRVMYEKYRHDPQFLAEFAYDLKHFVTSSIRLPRASIDRAGAPTTVETHGRHDPCVGIRAAPIAEAMLALVLMDHALRQRAQCGDVTLATPPIPGSAL